MKRTPVARPTVLRGRLALAAAATVVAAAAAATTAGCRTRLWEIPQPVDVSRDRVPTSCRQEEAARRVDVLFVIDNSTSMDAMQAELRKRFPEFLRVFRALEASGASLDLHLGVTTSDYGAGRSGSGNCEPSPGGQLGKLQPIGQFAAANCKPPVGANYIEIGFGPGAASRSNLPPGQSLEETFTCMASVGARGCGAEHQLESSRAALVTGLRENEGFLRDDALLAVVFVTNEDDCSAPADSDLFGVDQFARYGGDISVRCARYGVVCGDPPARPPYDSSRGPLDECVAAPNPGGAGPGLLFDVSRYTALYANPRAQGGLKQDPADVLLVSIAAPETPFEVILARPGTGNDGDPYERCPQLEENGNDPCVPKIDHSCQNPRDGAFFGDPAVRLAQVVGAGQNHAFSSICDDDFTAAMQNIANLIVSQLGECCLPEALPADPRTPADPDGFVADCTVEQVVVERDGSETVTALPQCALGGTWPCWRVTHNERCDGLSPQRLGVRIERAGAAAPPHATIRASCVGAKNATP